MRNLAPVLVATALLLPGLAQSAQAGDEGKAWLGIAMAQRVEVVNEEVSKEVKILQVFEGSPAEKAGLQEGDVILEINGAEVGDTGDIGEQLTGLSPGERVTLRILRDGREKRVRVRLGERPDDVKMKMKQIYAHVGEGGEVDTDAFVWHQGEGDFSWHAAPGGGHLAKVFVMGGGGPKIGVRIETLTEQLAGFFGVDGGVLVSEVIEGTPAEKAGLQAGDIITGAGGAAMSGAGDLQKAIRENGTDSPIRIDVMRKGQRLTFDMTPEGEAGCASPCCGGEHEGCASPCGGEHKGCGSACSGEKLEGCCPMGHGAKMMFIGDGETGDAHLAIQDALKKLEEMEIDIDVEQIQLSAQKALEEAKKRAAEGEHQEAKELYIKQMQLDQGGTI